MTTRYTLAGDTIRHAMTVSNSGFSTAGYLFGLLVMYAVGYWHAIWRRAKKDYKDTKASVPKLRKGMWTAFGKLVRSGAVVVIGLVLAIFWLMNEAKNAEKADPVPAKVPSSPSAPAKPR